MERVTKKRYVAKRLAGGGYGVLDTELNTLASYIRYWTMAAALAEANALNCENTFSEGLQRPTRITY